MSSIPQNYTEETTLVDCIQRFFSKHHVGKILKKCTSFQDCNGINRYFVS